MLKLIIIGDCGVGKTNLLMRYCENTFKMNYVSTIGVDFKIKSLRVGDTRLKFQIWDTAGQERYRNIAQTYYKNAAGIILTYSVNDEKSFANMCTSWIKQKNGSNKFRNMLLNK